MKRKSLKLLSMALISAMLLTACGGGSTTPEKKDEGNAENKPAVTDVATPKVNRIVTNNTSEPATLDPAKAQGTHESFPLQHMFVGITRNNKDGQVENALAEKIDISQDGLTYTITLKDGLKWSDGSPLTAHDFEFSWKRVLDPATESHYANQLYYVKGGQAYNEGKGSADDVAIKAKDDKTLEVVLDKPTAYFDGLMAFYTLYPVPKAIVEANPDWAKDPKTLVSNGAFQLKTWEHNAKISMDKNPNFYDAENVKIDGIDMDIIEEQNTAWQKYSSGEYNVNIDLPTEVVGQLKESESPELIIGKDVGTYYYNFNPEKKPLNNPKVRKALAFAIDRTIITDKIAKGGQIPATGVVPIGILDENGKDFGADHQGLVKYDPQEAKKLFEEGLAEENMKPEDVELTILYNTSEGHKAIAQAVQQMWNKELGINVGLENVEFKVKLDREKAGQYDISRAGWVGDYADPMTFMDLWLTGGSFNDAKYSNAEYDKLVKEAMTTTDQKLRMDNMKKAEKILLEEMPVSPIYFYTKPFTVKPNVTGIYKTLTQYPTLTYAEITLN